jgi:hypothetical protein
MLASCFYMHYISYNTRLTDIRHAHSQPSSSFLRGFLAIRPSTALPPHDQPTTKRLGQCVGQAWVARTSRPLYHQSSPPPPPASPSPARHHPPLGHHGAAIASLPSADSQPCTTAANPLPGVPTRSSGELQMRPPGCVCRRQTRSDSLTPGSSCSSCSSSACQTTLTRGLVLPIVCSAKA